MKVAASSSGDKRLNHGPVVPVTSPTPSISYVLKRKRRCIVSDPSSEVLESADLLRIILTKLPPKTVFGLKLVSKHWNKTISDPELVCLLKVAQNPAAVFVRRMVPHDSHVVKYTHIPLEGVAGGGPARFRRTPISLNLLEEEKFTHVTFMIEHSSNGLLICSSSDNPRSYFLYNPTTKKHVRIPELKAITVISWHISFQASDTYKIIAVYLSRGSENRFQLQVLEPNKSLLHWRNTWADFPVGLGVVNYQYGVYIDGVIYWPCYRSSGLMFFNVREETVHWLPEVPQPYNNFTGIAYFGECKGNLCMVAEASMRGATFDMLELKADRSMWFIKHHIDLTPRARRTNNFQILVLALLPGEKEGDDSYLIVHILREVVTYNLRDGTMRKLCDLGLRTTESLLLRSQPWNYVHPYKHSHVCPRLTAS